MWLLSKHSRSRPSRAQLESSLLQCTVALQKLSQQFVKVRDEERRRIARDLHDTTGQTLAALKMAVFSLEYKLKQNQETADVLDDIGTLADQALTEIRTTSYLLHPPLLDEVGFVAAAQWYVEGFAERSGIKTCLDFVKGPERLSIEIETVLFRVLQEGLTNVHRHSGTSMVTVSFQHHAETVVLKIADCGCGMSEQVLKNLCEGGAEIGVGLAGMRERLDELGGSLEINSGVCGTTLRASVPLIIKDLSIRCSGDCLSISPSTVDDSSVGVTSCE